MSTFPNRRRTTGTTAFPVPSSNAAPSHDRDLEHGTSLHNETLVRPMSNTAHYGGARSIRIVPTVRARDTQTAEYSQTPDSIRDRTMMLSNLALQVGMRDGTGAHMDTGDSRRSSMDDRSSIGQLLADASAGAGNLSRLLRERPASAHMGQHEPGGAGVSRVDYSYIGADRVPKNAKLRKHAHAEGVGEDTVAWPGDYGNDERPMAVQGQPSPTLHADMSKLHTDRAKLHTDRGNRPSDMAKQHSDDAHVPGEQDRLLGTQVCLTPEAAMGGDNGYARLQRRSHAALNLLMMPLQYIPAVVLGLIMNLLDGLSYGLIAFPVSIPVFDKFGPAGFSMYMLSSAIAQFVYSSGASAFRGANGTMLIEAIPFLYAICNKIVSVVGVEQPDRVIATTMAAYATSTIITGLVFFLLGFLRIGVLVDFFPRHILVGCIGGVGYFLMQTGMEVTSQIQLSLSWPVLRELFAPNALGLWGSSLGLAVLLRVLCTRFTHPLFVPMFFMVVPAMFYITTAALGLSMETLRATGWVFALPDAGEPFYHFYTLFDFGNTDWHAIVKAVPTMLGLAFFSILHVPINVPALAVSTNVDKIDTNRELLAHGISNLASGCLGSFQNYLVYSNSVLFIRSGGDSNLAGMILGVVTLGVFISGPSIIGYIPTMVVGALIFHLGLELVKESLVDTIGVVNRIEYVTIVVIVLAMATIGFNEGIFIGIMMACFFFILLYSRRTALRKAYTGSAVRSTVRRLYSQRRFLDDVCRQIQVMRLQGFMFFGTINGIEAYIRNLLEQCQWQENPIRFLVLDFALVNGMDFSAAEAFIRVRRLLEAREIYMVICGAEKSTEVGRALRSAAGVWSDDESEYVQTAQSLNEALEWCENVLLQFYYLHQAAEHGTEMPHSYSFVSTPQFTDVDMYGSSPRHAMVTEATHSAMPSSHNSTPSLQAHQAPAFPLLHQAFMDLDSDVTADETLAWIAPHFERKQHPPAQHVWLAGSSADAMYIVESGTLRVYVENGSESEAVESILPGTLLGELALITGQPHGTTVVSDGSVVMWELSKSVFDELSAAEPAKMLAFVRLALMYPAQGMKAITAYAFCAQ
ncbi:hypothetical protein J3F80_002649 [Coemansia sp. RSA 2526]|nr:hypothetical protein J3F80_002649 [Coemansia sp. RSA 2526]